MHGPVSIEYVASPALCNFQKNLLLSGWSVAYREGHSTNQLDDSLACGLLGKHSWVPHKPLAAIVLTNTYMYIDLGQGYKNNQVLHN